MLIINIIINVFNNINSSQNMPIHDSYLFHRNAYKEEKFYEKYNQKTSNYSHKTYNNY